MKDIVVRIKFFGAFRQYGEALDFSVPAGSNAETVKKIFSGQIEGMDELLVQSSVLANDDAVLTSTDVLNKDCTISILPPVCGG